MVNVTFCYDGILGQLHIGIKKGGVNFHWKLIHFYINFRKLSRKNKEFQKSESFDFWNFLKFSKVIKWQHFDFWNSEISLLFLENSWDEFHIFFLVEMFSFISIYNVPSTLS